MNVLFYMLLGIFGVTEDVVKLERTIPEFKELGNGRYRIINPRSIPVTLNINCGMEYETKGYMVEGYQNVTIAVKVCDSKSECKPATNCSMFSWSY